MLKLRKFQTQDSEILISIRNDMEINDLLLLNKKNKINNNSELNYWIAHRNEKGFFKIISLGNFGIGYIQLTDIDYLAATAWFGIAISKIYQGKNFGFIAMEKLHAFSKKLSIKTLLLKVREDNLNAIKLYKKLGYKFSKKVVENYENNSRKINIQIWKKDL